ncbi:hypothetical protein ART_3293 [Arthrobacter sp. PAMC 25486]|nr:hypothetical protein ART_3293 [Arthrobacter sp. PAMC 25486]
MPHNTDMRHARHEVSADWDTIHARRRDPATARTGPEGSPSVKLKEWNLWARRRWQLWGRGPAGPLSWNGCWRTTPPKRHTTQRKPGTRPPQPHPAPCTST